MAFTYSPPLTTPVPAAGGFLNEGAVGSGSLASGKTYRVRAVAHHLQSGVQAPAWQSTWLEDTITTTHATSSIIVTFDVDANSYGGVVYFVDDATETFANTTNCRRGSYNANCTQKSGSTVTETITNTTRSAVISMCMYHGTLPFGLDHTLGCGKLILNSGTITAAQIAAAITTANMSYYSAGVLGMVCSIEEGSNPTGTMDCDSIIWFQYGSFQPGTNFTFTTSKESKTFFYINITRNNSMATFDKTEFKGAYLTCGARDIITDEAYVVGGWNPIAIASSGSSSIKFTNVCISTTTGAWLNNEPITWNNVQFLYAAFNTNFLKSSGWLGATTVYNEWLRVRRYNNRFRDLKLAGPLGHTYPDYDNDIYMEYSTASPDIHILNLDCTERHADNIPTILYSADPTGTVYLYFEFNVRVRDANTTTVISGATINLWNASKNPDVDAVDYTGTTDANGVLASDLEVLWRSGTRTSGGGVNDTTWTVKSPYTLEVYKAGYLKQRMKVNIDSDVKGAYFPIALWKVRSQNLSPTTKMFRDAIQY